MTKSTAKIILDDKTRERLIRALELRGKLGKRGDKTQIAKDTSYSKNHVGWMLDGKKPLQERFVKLLCSVYHISEQSVLYGAHNDAAEYVVTRLVRQVNPQENELLELWGKLTEDEKQALLILLKKGAS